MFRIKDDKGSMNIEKIARTLENVSSRTKRTKRRFDFESEQKLFSLLDINDSITNNRGTSLPSQYKRLSNQEVIDLYGEDFARENKLLSLNKKESHHRTLSRNQTEPKHEIKHFKTEYNERNVPYSKDDKWKPNNFKRYEYLLHNPKLIAIEGMNNKFAKKLPNYTIKEIRDKSYNSDIFFIKKRKPFLMLNNVNNITPTSTIEDNSTCKTEINENVNKYTIPTAPYGNPHESDIFFINNNERTQKKSGEVYLYKPQKIESYTTSKESKSEWAVQTTLPSLLNHTSSHWHILSPQSKNISYTKDQIIECNNKQGVNPIYRPKSLCEFIDLTRVGAPNPNKTYLDSFHKTHGCFKKRTDICGAYHDIHKMYKDICAKPFIKPNIA